MLWHIKDLVYMADEPKAPRKRASKKSAADTSAAENSNSIKIVVQRKKPARKRYLPQLLHPSFRLLRALAERVPVRSQIRVRIRNLMQNQKLKAATKLLRNLKMKRILAVADVAVAVADVDVEKVKKIVRSLFLQMNRAKLHHIAAVVVGVALKMEFNLVRA